MLVPVNGGRILPTTYHHALPPSIVDSCKGWARAVLLPSFLPIRHLIPTNSFPRQQPTMTVFAVIVATNLIDLPRTNWFKQVCTSQCKYICSSVICRPCSNIGTDNPRHSSPLCSSPTYELTAALPAKHHLQKVQVPTYLRFQTLVGPAVYNYLSNWCFTLVCDRLFT